jgi:hypothetical protein
VLIGAVLLPARTFQQPYLTLLTMLAGAGWLLAAPPGRDETVPLPSAPEADRQPAP